MTDGKFLGLYPSAEVSFYVGGVPTRGRIVEIQAEQIIAEISPNRWAAQYLEPEAALAFARMREAAMQDGLKLWIYSGYRSHEHQERLWREWNEGKRKLRPSRPGWSRHESGQAADILRAHDVPKTDNWLAANANKFGYYQTLPHEKWHFEHKRG